MKKQAVLALLLSMFMCFMLMVAGCSPTGSDNDDNNGNEGFIKKI